MRKEKQLLLDEIKDKIDASSAMIITSYEKLEPNTSWKFRDLLGKQGSIFEVVRKRVFLKAAEKAGLSLDHSLLKGHVGVVFINQPDAMAPAKTVFKFSDDNAKLFQVVCGQIDGKLMPGTEVEMLSKLPGMDEMRAILIALFISPMTHTLSVLEAKMGESLSTLEQNT